MRQTSPMQADQRPHTPSQAGGRTIVLHDAWLDRKSLAPASIAQWNGLTPQASNVQRPLLGSFERPLVSCRRRARIQIATAPSAVAAPETNDRRRSHRRDSMVAVNPESSDSARAADARSVVAAASA